MPPERVHLPGLCVCTSEGIFRSEHAQLHVLTAPSARITTSAGCQGAAELPLLRGRHFSLPVGNAPFMRHSLTCLSSAPETMRGRLGWNAAQLTPPVMPLQHILHHCIPAAKKIRIHLHSALLVSTALKPAFQASLAGSTAEQAAKAL